VRTKQAVSNSECCCCKLINNAGVACWVISCKIGIIQTVLCLTLLRKYVSETVLGWNGMQSVKVNQNFEGICCLQCWSISQAENLHDAGMLCLLPAYCLILAGFLHDITMKTNVTSSTETSADFQRATQWHVPEDRTLQVINCLHELSKDGKRLHFRIYYILIVYFMTFSDSCYTAWNDWWEWIMNWKKCERKYS
jgi:hypothetical protein